MPVEEQVVPGVVHDEALPAVHCVSDGRRQMYAPPEATQFSPEGQSRVPASGPAQASWHRENAQMRGSSQSLLMAQPSDRPTGAAVLLQLL
jgi:hypothetical protein